VSCSYIIPWIPRAGSKYNWLCIIYPFNFLTADFGTISRHPKHNDDYVDSSRLGVYFIFPAIEKMMRLLLQAPSAPF